MTEIPPGDSRETPVEKERKNAHARTRRTKKSPPSLSEKGDGSNKQLQPATTEPCPATEIGPGWTVITNVRKATNKKGFREDKYYITPKNKIRLRSKPEVNRFLAALKVLNGDETEALAAMKATSNSIVANGCSKINRKNTTNSDSNVNLNEKQTPKKTTKTTRPKTKQQRKAPRDQDDNFDPPPKRPPSTYLLYTTKIRRKIAAENPEKSPVEISRILGGIWKDLAESEKKKLQVQYDKEFEDYRKLQKEWELRNPGRSVKTESRKRKRSKPTSPISSSPVNSLTAAAAVSSQKKAKIPEGTDWFEVEGFRDRRINRNTNKVEYLIKWRGCPESSNTWEPSENLNIQDDAKAWWKQETARRNNLTAQKTRINESMKNLGLDGDLSAFDELKDIPLPSKTICRREKAPAEATKATMGLLEDETWNWDDASQITFRSVQRICVHEPRAREAVTEARINGTPVVLTGHVGWANFALRWMRRKDGTEETGKMPSENGVKRKNGEKGRKIKKYNNQSIIEKTVNRMEVPGEEKKEHDDESFEPKHGNAPRAFSMGAEEEEKVSPGDEIYEKKEDAKIKINYTMGNKTLLDLSDPEWYLDIEAMAKDIGDEEVPVVRKNYNESKPISGNILASKFFEAGWKAQKEEPTPLQPGKRRKSILYLHQWQFPLSVTACKKLCHQNNPLPNHILGEDLLKYWLDRVKLDSPLQYLFMGNSDTMSKVHRDNGGLAISIAPITGKKECILVHRDDGQACLYHNQAPLDPDSIDLNAYPLLPYARIWKTTITPGEVLLMPHGTYHQCRNVTPCLSYSRFHLDGVNLRAFLHSMMDGDAPELDQDTVLWNSTRELIDVVDKATDDKRKPDEELIKNVDALRALRNIAKEVSRKLYVRETVKGPNPSASVVSSSVHIDGTGELWQSLVDDVDICLHEFRYRFNRKIPSFRRRRSIGKKILALPSLPFRGKSKPSEKELKQGRNEPVVAFECPADRGFLALPKAPLKVSPADRKKVNDAIDSIVVGDEMVVRIAGRKCPARVTEVLRNAQVVRVSFEDLPSLYDDFVPCDLLRTSSVGGSCLSTPLSEEIKPGKIFVCLMGKDEYRGVVQYLETGHFFRSKLDFGNGYSIDKMIDPKSILSISQNSEKLREQDDDGNDLQNKENLEIRTTENDANPILNAEQEYTNEERKLSADLILL